MRSGSRARAPGRSAPGDRRRWPCRGACSGVRGEQAPDRGRANFLPTVSKAQPARGPVHRRGKPDAGDRFQQQTAGCRPARSCRRRAAAATTTNTSPRTTTRGGTTEDRQKDSACRRPRAPARHEERAKDGAGRGDGGDQCAATAANIEKGTLDPGRAGHGARRGRRSFAALARHDRVRPGHRDAGVRRSASTTKPRGTAG